MTNIANEIKELSDKLNYYNEQYYQNSISEISDLDFDKLIKRLKMLEGLHPEFKQPDSPTFRVGGTISKKFQQLKHRYTMLSLSNTYSSDELREFDERVAKGLENKAENKTYEYIAEMKYDGVAITLIYQNGILTNAVTRGDGEQGDDVIFNVKTIKNIPLKVVGDNVPDYFEVRGEIYMPKESFDAINAEIEEDNKEKLKKGLKTQNLLANPRNAASGTIKMFDSGVVAKRNLACIVYDLLGENLPYLQHEESLATLKKWKFNVFADNRKCKNIEEVINYIEEWATKRYDLPYDTDGAVVKLNDKSQREYLGFTAKSPRWAIAYKYKAEKKSTILESVTYQVGRTGAVTPVANLKPVKLGGTMIKRATLHNANEIVRLDLHEKDTVFVEKSGEIIPKITGVDTAKRNIFGKKIQYITNCPECNTELMRNEEEVAFYCPNEKCPAQIRGKIEHFVSRKAMNIDSLGGKTIEVFFDNKLIQDISDLYDTQKVNFEAITKLDGFKKQSAENILKGIEESKKQPFKNVLFGLGIRYIGENSSEKLADFFKNIDNIINASAEELQQAPEIGEKIAVSLFAYLKEPENLALINRLRAAGVQFESSDMPKEILSEKLIGKTFLISGTFDGFGREELKEIIEQHGGKVLSGVSSKLNFLVAGKEAGASKLDKAAKLNVTVIVESDFVKMIN